MMRTRRTTALTLALLVAGAALAGCSGGGSPGGDAASRGAPGAGAPSAWAPSASASAPAPSQSAVAPSGSAPLPPPTGRTTVVFAPEDGVDGAQLRRIGDLLRNRAAALPLSGTEVRVVSGRVEVTAAGDVRTRLRGLAARGDLEFRPVQAFGPSGSAGGPTPEADGVAQAVLAAYGALDCSDAAQRTDRRRDAATATAACGREAEGGQWPRFLLGPVAVGGARVAKAAAEFSQDGGGWQVRLDLDTRGAAEFQAVTGRLAAQLDPANQIAVVLDGLVVSHPMVATAIPGGRVQISGAFTRAAAEGLAATLNSGTLPVPVREQSAAYVP